MKNITKEMLIAMCEKIGVTHFENEDGTFTIIANIDRTIDFEFDEQNNVKDIF